MKSAKIFKNTDERNIEVIRHCSKLLILLHLLNFEHLQPSSCQCEKICCLQNTEPAERQILSINSTKTSSASQQDATKPLSNINVAITNIEELAPAKAVDLDDSDVKITHRLALRLKQEIRAINCDCKRFSTEETQKFFWTFIDLDYRISWSKRKA